MFRDELNRRAYERDAEAMHQLTQQTVRLTEQTVRLTRVNTVVAILAIIVGVVVPLLSEQALRPHRFALAKASRCAAQDAYQRPEKRSKGPRQPSLP
jgi:hypothetical protein